MLMLLQIVFIDQSRDMYVRAVASNGPAVKMASMVDCALWHDSVGMLAYIADHKLVCSCCHQLLTGYCLHLDVYYMT